MGTTRIKTGELIGVALDWAVAKCEGVEFLFYDPPRGETRESPSTNWSQGGPIIEREMIWLGSDGVGGFDARIYEPDSEPWCEYGQTMLIAAMRCYVASKLGDEVEIPEELL